MLFHHVFVARPLLPDLMRRFPCPSVKLMFGRQVFAFFREVKNETQTPVNLPDLGPFPELPPVTTLRDAVLKEVRDSDSLVNSTEQDLKVRKALAWKALNVWASLWHSKLPRQIKLSFFYAIVESVLLHGSECWTPESNFVEISGQELHENVACSA